MTRNRTLALVAAALVALTAFTGAVAAAPGNGNADGTNSDDREAGPPSDLPGPVPDFVERIHERITAFVDGSIDHLGAAVSDVANDNAQDESAGTDGDGGAGDSA